MDREKDGSNLEGRAPLVLQDIKTDSTEVVDVGVIYLGAEDNFRGRHGVLIGEKELSIENTT